MTGHDLACLVADARRDISDADRCLMLHVEPSVGQLHRRLREVTDALDALSTPPADDVREANELRQILATVISDGFPPNALDYRAADEILADSRLQVNLTPVIGGHGRSCPCQTWRHGTRCGVDCPTCHPAQSDGGQK